METPDIFGRAFQVRMKERLLRDPVHGLIPIDENSEQGRLLVRLIDSAEMQRLRRIRQLGLAHYAFQGAEHSRFVHSVGVFHLARQIAEQLGRMHTIDSELSFYAQVAALLHDLGHGPFSHVSERIFGLDHEAWTVRILHDPESEVGAILSSHSRRLPSIIESMLIGMAKPGYLCSLVSGELDADRLDYLLRDSLMTGVKYGVFELDRLLHMLRISPEGDRIVVAHGGMAPVEKYIQARYHMHRQVYFHKTVIAAEGMLTLLLRRAADLAREGDGLGLPAGDVTLRALRDAEGLSTAEYLQMDDVEILSRMKLWARGADPILRDLSARLLHRRLFKTLDLDPAIQGLEARIEEARGALRRAGLDPDYSLLRVDASDTPYHPYDPDSKKRARPILIEDARGRIADVAESSPTIQAFTRSPYLASRLVFADSGPSGSVRAEIESIFGARRE